MGTGSEVLAHHRRIPRALGETFISGVLLGVMCISCQFLPRAPTNYMPHPDPTITCAPLKWEPIDYAYYNEYWKTPTTAGYDVALGENECALKISKTNLESLVDSAVLDLFGRHYLSIHFSLGSTIDCYDSSGQFNLQCCMITDGYGSCIQPALSCDPDSKSGRCGGGVGLRAYIDPARIKVLSGYWRQDVNGGVYKDSSTSSDDLIVIDVPIRIVEYFHGNSDVIDRLVFRVTATYVDRIATELESYPYLLQESLPPPDRIGHPACFDQYPPQHECNKFVPDLLACQGDNFASQEEYETVCGAPCADTLFKLGGQRALESSTGVWLGCSSTDLVLRCERCTPDPDATDRLAQPPG